MKKKLFVITLLVMFLLSISVCAFADQRTDNYPKTVYVNVLNLTTGVTRSEGIVAGSLLITTLCHYGGPGNLYPLDLGLQGINSSRNSYVCSNITRGYDATFSTSITESEIITGQAYPVKHKYTYTVTLGFSHAANASKLNDQVNFAQYNYSPTNAKQTNLTHGNYSFWSKK